MSFLTREEETALALSPYVNSGFMHWFESEFLPEHDKRVRAEALAPVRELIDPDAGLAWLCLPGHRHFNESEIRAALARADAEEAS